jgi:CheY-like chemotaxis protein
VSSDLPLSQPDSLSHCWLLVVDEDEISRELLVILLEDAGATVVTAASESEALQRMTIFIPDVIIYHVGRSGQVDRSFITAMRALPRSLGGRVPVVAINDDASNASLCYQALELGFEACLEKSQITSLLQVIIEVVERGR